MSAQFFEDGSSAWLDAPDFFTNEVFLTCVTQPSNARNAELSQYAAFFQPGGLLLCESGIPISLPGGVISRHWHCRNPGIPDIPKTSYDLFV